MTKKAKDHEDAARWAEDDMVLPENSKTARRGAAAAKAGRALLARARRTPTPRPGSEASTESPKRQVRLPLAVSEQVDAIAQAQGRKAAEVMRDAITLYAKEQIR